MASRSSATRPRPIWCALRHAGAAHLLAVAREAGARRFVTQSRILGYGYRDRPLTGDDPFGEPEGGYADSVAAGCRATAQQAFQAAGVEGIALRYGLFYGPRAFGDLFAGMTRRRVPYLPSGGRGRRPRHAQAEVPAESRPRSRPLLRPAAPYLDWLTAATSMRVSNARARDDLGWTPAYRSVHARLTRRRRRSRTRVTARAPSIRHPGDVARLGWRGAPARLPPALPGQGVGTSTPACI
ncbi:NAD(P)-dependent oxidoreductase [Nonomuraea sp. SYSU D8015]|uniref:NAD(P)-dependent oxidoreductase n=1 Tax=Nonomuraea sp. SYSU D8015 TaxID=2593644 RepID=UPI00166150A9|nr:NAD(P)-dependent oxidoreductase [Nonomuraea sp. SYSU D8015]